MSVVASVSADQETNLNIHLSDTEIQAIDTAPESVAIALYVPDIQLASGKTGAFYLEGVKKRQLM